MVEIVRRYSAAIENGRTLQDAHDALVEEVGELKEELENGSTGADGIKGECMDVINCALDILFMAYPDIPDAEIDALMERKCQKWASKYADGPKKRPPTA